MAPCPFVLGSQTLHASSTIGTQRWACTHAWLQARQREALELQARQREGEERQQAAALEERHRAEALKQQQEAEVQMALEAEGWQVLCVRGITGLYGQQLEWQILCVQRATG